MAITDDFNYPTEIGNALDTHAAQAGESSIWDDAANLVTKAVPLTIASAANSFINTAVDVSNWFGANNQRIEIEDEFDSDYSEYYRAHQTGIDAVGLVAGSLIPGLGAVKLGSAAVKAGFLLKAGYSSEVLAQATGLLAPIRARVVANALQEVASSGSLYQGLAADKIKMLALGAGEMALQGMLMETATMATMKASPLLDKDSLGDVVGNILLGGVTGIGGAVTFIGGGIEGYLGYRYLGKAVARTEAAAQDGLAITRLTDKGQMYAPGDQAAVLMQGIDRLSNMDHTGASPLRLRRASDELSSAKQDFFTQISRIGKEGEEDVSHGFALTAMEKYEKGELTSDDIINKLSRLAAIRRVDSDATVPTGDIFAINRFPKANGRFAPTVDDLITTGSHDEATFSRYYQMKDNAGPIQMGHARDMVVNPVTGEAIEQFPTVKDAYRAGKDVYVDKNNIVHVNPDAPNIREQVPQPGLSRKLTSEEAVGYKATGSLPEGAADLFGAPMFQNLITGELTAAKQFVPGSGAVVSGITRVVGDFGKPQLTDVGIVAGKKTFLQNYDSVITPTTTPENASARYVWAEKKGLARNQTVDATDIPFLEKMYRDAQSQIASNKDTTYSNVLESWEKKNITLSDEHGTVDIPGSLDELAEHIQSAKNDLIQATDAANGGAKSTMTSKDMAALANVPEKYITEGFQAAKPEDYMVPIEQHQRVNTVQLEYKMGQVHNMNDNMIAQGAIDLQYRINLIQDAAQAAAAVRFGDKLSEFTISRNASAADTSGAGAKFVSFANAAYNTLAQEMERVGRSVTAWHSNTMQAISKDLMPSITALRADPVAAMEHSSFVTIRRMTGEKYQFLPAEIAQSAGVSENTVVLSSSLKDTKGGLVWDRNHTPEGFISNQTKMWEAAADGTNLGTPQIENGLHTSYELSQKVADFERANQTINDTRNIAKNRWRQAMGLPESSNLPVGTLYAPPIDVSKYPFFAYIRDLEGKGGSDGGVGIITAKTGEELAQKTAGFKDNYQIIYKDDNQKFREARGDYDYSRNFADTQLNAEMRRQGVLNNIYPESNVEATIQDYIGFHSRQELRLTRDYTELNNTQFFAELAAKGETFAKADTSQRGWLGSVTKSAPDNPYDTYRTTALAINPKENYKMWYDAQEKGAAFFNKAFDTARDAFISADKGMLSYEEASKVTAKMGLPNAYASAVDGLKAYSDTAYNVPNVNWLGKFLGTAHSVMSATLLRLDAFQAMVNVVSTPVLMLSEAQAAIKAGSELLTVALPDGSGRRAPSVLKLMAQGTTSFVTRDVDHAEIMPLLKKIGAVRDKDSTYVDMVRELALPKTGSTWEQAQASLSKAADIGQKYTGNTLAEEMSRYVPGYMAYKIFSEAGQTGQALEDNIATFVNRVQGNYVASQRPVAFQGPIGSALSLFQTYNVNLIQQLLRHVEEGNGKSLAMMMGAQTTLFGLNGLPGFQMLNHSIVANAYGNADHTDAYSAIPDWAGKDLGKWLMYGGLSNVLNTGLYSRGDINPRQVTILPVNPLDFPAISGGIKFAGNLIDTAGKIADGGSIPASLLLGLEHNGLSRPLSGLAQIVQGFATTGKGTVISPPNTDTTQGWNNLISGANLARLGGARPLDEAIMMDAKYQQTVYQAKDATRKAMLGEAVKTQVYGDETSANLTPEVLQRFASEYAKTGGTQTGFNQWVVQQVKEANTGVAAQIFKANATPSMQNVQRIMGGQPLGAFNTSGPSTAVAPVTAQPGARKAADGFSYVPDPSRPGQYMKIVE